MPDPLSLNVQHLKASETVAISTEARRRKAAGEDVLDLGVGEPDFDTPAAAAQAGIQAIQQGRTRYPPNIGIAELRRAMARHLSTLSGGRAVDPERIMISSGSKQSLFNACFALFGPKDKVLIPSPAWVSYPQIVHLRPRGAGMVPGDIEWGLKVSVRISMRTTAWSADSFSARPAIPPARSTPGGDSRDRGVGRARARSGSSRTRSIAASTTARDPRRRSSTCRTSCWSAW